VSCGATIEPVDRARTTLLPLLVAAALPAFFIGNALLVLLHPWLIDAQYALPGFPDDGLGLTGDERRELAHTGVQSIAVWDGAGIERLRDARLPDGAPAFGAREITHMEDVRAVVTGFAWAWVAGVVALFAGAFALRRRHEPAALARGLRWGAWLTLGSFAALALVMLVDFDAFFDGFHGIFFSGDSWRFADDDTLLALYPDTFWGVAAGATAALVIGQALIAFLVAKRVNDRSDG
jgi:integral membrane protein (TIGR01906 family)